MEQSDRTVVRAGAWALPRAGELMLWLASFGLGGLLVLARLIWLDFVAGVRFVLHPWLIRQGFLPYRDIADQHAPLLPAVLALLVPFFPDPLTLNYVVLAAVLLATVILVVLVSRQLFGRTAAIAALVFFMLWEPVFATHGLYYESALGMLYLLALLVWHGTSGAARWRPLLSGLLLGTAVLVKQQAIIVVLGYIAWRVLVSYHREEPAHVGLKDIAVFTAGAMFLPALSVIYFAIHGILGEYFFWTVTFNFGDFAEQAVKWPTWKQAVYIAPAFLLVPPFLFWGVQSWRRGRHEAARLALLAILLAGSLTPVYPRFELFHFEAAVPLLAVVAGAVIQYGLSLGETRARTMISLRATAGTPGVRRVVFLLALLVLLTLPSASEPYRSRLGRERQVAEYAALAPLGQWLQDRTGPDDRIFVFPDTEDTANLYVLSKREPPGYWSVAYPWHTTVPAVRERLLRGIREAPPQWIVYAPDIAIAGVILKDAVPEVSDYLIQSSISVRTLVLPRVGRVWLMVPRTSPSVELVPLFRLRRATSDDYFYTTDPGRRDVLQGDGYVYAGICCQVFAREVEATTALFQLRHTPTGRHFYTTSAMERDAAVQQLHYISEGVAGYCYPSDGPQPPGSQPLWRLIKPGVHHFYTTSATERDQYVENGYRIEGIACYVPAH